MHVSRTHGGGSSLLQVHLAQDEHQPVVEAMARELLQAAEENGYVQCIILRHA